jgi:hypothetical protein
MNGVSHRGKEHKWLSRFAWLVLIWVVSVSVLGAAAWLMRLVMRAGGLTS